MTPTDLEGAVRARFIAGGGLLLVLVLSGQMYVWINLWPLRIDGWTALAWSMPQIVLWALTIHGIDALATRLPIDGPRAPALIVVHLAASVAIALVVLAALDLSDRLLGWTHLLGAPATLVTRIDKTVLHLHIGIAIYWVVLAANHARRYYRGFVDRELHATRLEALLVEAQLSALRMQLDPHFLFNTLNSIGVLMWRDVAQAERMLARLSEFLRGTLQYRGANDVPLRIELDYVRAYLDIERVRFGGRLVTEVRADRDLEECAVPYLILQPLVENAIKHGVGRRNGVGTITVEAIAVGEMLMLTVRDDGVGLATNTVNRGLGVGLSNVVKRLEHAYGADHRFELRAVPGGGTEAIVTMPRRSMDAHAHADAVGA